MIKNGLPYQSQWIEIAWKGLPGYSRAPHDGYCRTQGDWLKVFAASGLRPLSIRKPVNDTKKLPVSIIFTLEKGIDD